MLYLLDWLRKKISKWVNNSYPSSKNSSTDGDSKRIFASFSYHFSPNNKISENSKFTFNNSNSLFKDLNIICGKLDLKNPEMHVIFVGIIRDYSADNFYNRANQFCVYGR